MTSSTQLNACGHDVLEHDWSIGAAVQYVVGSGIFYNQLGKKIRWGRDVLYGAQIDFDLKLSASEERGWLSVIGQYPFHMPDVGGYIRDYQDKHLMEMHRFFYDIVYRYFNTDAFKVE